AAAVASSRPSLDVRVLPYVRDVPLTAVPWSFRLTSDRAVSAAAALLQPAVERAAARLGHLLGGHAAVQRRLDRASSPLSVQGFRMSQVVWGFAGFGATLMLGLAGPARQADRALSWLLACGCAGLLGVMARDSVLS